MPPFHSISALVDFVVGTNSTTLFIQLYVSIVIRSGLKVLQLLSSLLGAFLKAGQGRSALLKIIVKDCTTTTTGFAFALVLT